ncbi:MAG: DUF3187 family protein [Planctomycetes bacterium]|nr:DUF3187 family protein [Planctomycetota bacterium]
MKRRAAVGALVACASCASVPRFDGPLAVRNQHPAQLTVQRLSPRSAEVLDASTARVDLSTAYSSYFLSGSDSRGSFIMDGELLRTAAAVRVGLGGGFDVAAELPVLHASGGFLDDFVVDWHDWFGFPDQGRDAAPSDAVAIRAVRDGATVFEVEPNGLHLGDVPIVLTFAPWSIDAEHRVGVALRGGVELPAGDEDAGFGNGGIDAALGVVCELRTGPIAWTAQAAHSFARTPDRARAAGLAFGDVSSFDLGAEVALADSCSFLVQTQYESSTLRGLGFGRAADDQWLLWIALRHRLSDGTRLEWGLGEDLSGYIAPDFSAWLSVTMDVGPH